MNIQYVIEEDVVGVVNASKYEIEDSENNLKDWHKLQSDFSKEFSEFSKEDYDLTDWHNGIKCLFVYLYNYEFYTKDFIPRILNILKMNGDCLAQFECYDNEQELLGSFQVYMDKIYLEEMLEENGIVDQLCVNRDDKTLIF